MIRKTLIGLCAAGLVTAMAGAASAQVTFSASYGAANLAAPGTATLTMVITNNTADPLLNTLLDYTVSSPTNLAGSTFSGSCVMEITGTATRITIGVFPGPRDLPANSTCTFTNTFTAAAGTHVLSSATVTYDGGGAVALTPGANPTMVVAAPAPVPTLSEWGLILFGLVLAGGTALVLQRRMTQA